MRSYLQFVLKFRFAILALVFSVTCAAGWQITQGVFGSSMVKLFFGQSVKYAEYEKLMAEFGSSDVMVVAFDEAEVFSKESLTRIGKISECLEDHKDIRRVYSLSNSQRLRNVDDDLLVENYLDIVSRTPTAAKQLKREALQEENLVGLWLSKNGDSTAIGVEFVPDDSRPAESLPQLINEIYACFIENGIAQEKLHSAGVVVESSEATAVAIETLAKTVPLTSLFLVVMVFILFRRFWPVTITAGIALIAVSWTFAFSIIWDRQINIMLSAVPAVMMVVCFSDVIHLCSAYLLELKAGASKQDAIEKSATEVGVACMFTSITTFVGFISLSFVPTPAFQQLGVVLGFGVAVALLLAVTLAPIYFSLIPEPQAPTTQRRNLLQDFVDFVARQSLFLSTRFPKIIALAFCALMAVSAFGASKIRIETDFMARLSPDSRSRVDHEYMKLRFAGSNIVDLYISTDKDGILDPKLIHGLARAENKLLKLAEVDQVIGIVTVFKELGKTMGTPPLPDTRQGLAQYLLLFEMSGGDSVESLLNADRSKTRLSLRLNSSGLVATADAGNRAAEILRTELGDAVKVTPTGLTFLLGDWIDDIMAGQARGLIFAFLVTTIMMMFCLRAVRAALISMIPNALPLIVLGGYLGLAWETVDSDLAFVALIAIGIGVDDTIHFLTRLRLEMLRSKDTDAALKNTFDYTGRAIVQTTLILTAGFLPFLWTDYLSLTVMGTLLPMCLIVALIADLLFVPALVKLGILKF
jgi:predicted RND superfamily exporter protein